MKNFYPKTAWQSNAFLVDRALRRGDVYCHDII
jgi:hypothetical protein